MEGKTFGKRRFDWEANEIYSSKYLCNSVPTLVEELFEGLGKLELDQKCEGRTASNNSKMASLKEPFECD